MIYRPVLRQRPWYDTPLARSYGFTGLATRLIARVVAYAGYPQAANDGDYWSW